MIPVKVLSEGKTVELMLQKGANLLKELKKHDIKINDACEGSLGCGTCHVHVDPQAMQKLTPACEKEEDLLNFVPQLKPFSRLACGMQVEDALRDTTIKIPSQNRNLLSEHDM